MKHIPWFLAAAALCALPALAPAARAEDLRTHWVARGDDHHFRVAYTGKDADGKAIWLATDDAPGGRELLEEIGRYDTSIVLQSRKHPQHKILITDTKYFVTQGGNVVFERSGGWQR